MFLEYDCQVCGKHRRAKRSPSPSAPVACSRSCRDVWLGRYFRERGICNLPHYRGQKHGRWVFGSRKKRCEKCGRFFGPNRNITTFRRRRFYSTTCGPGYKWTSGPGTPRWRGGLQARLDSGARTRSCTEQVRWSKSVMERDHYTCRWCGRKGGDLHAHHVRPFRDFPELRWELSNGITLCKPCHFSTYRS